MFPVKGEGGGGDRVGCVAKVSSIWRCNTAKNDTLQHRSPETKQCTGWSHCLRQTSVAGGNGPSSRNSPQKIGSCCSKAAPDCVAQPNPSLGHWQHFTRCRHIPSGLLVVVRRRLDTTVATPQFSLDGPKTRQARCRCQARRNIPVPTPNSSRFDRNAHIEYL